METDRVAVLEPRPDLPAGAMPVFGELMEKGRKRAQNQAILSVPFALLGVILFFADFGIAVPVFLLVVFVPYAVFWIRCAVVVGRAGDLLGTAFRPLHLGAEDVLVSDSKVSLRVPGDGVSWLVARLPEASQLQLAGQRRVWVLGPDKGGRVFVQLPGTLALYRGRLRPEPESGSEPLAEVSREPVSPREDPVLSAHRRRVTKAVWILTGSYLGYVAALLWVYFDFPAEPGRFVFIPGVALVLAAMFGAVSVVNVVGIAKFAKALPEGTWTELRVTVDRLVQVTPRGLAKLTGRTMLADGREMPFRLANVDPSLAANIATTGQLWIVGTPRLGKGVTAAVPGYPVIGNVRLGV